MLYQALLKRDNLLSQLDADTLTEVLYKVAEASTQFRESSTADLYYEIDFYNNVVRDLVAAGLDPNVKLYKVSLFTHLLEADNHIAVGYLASHPKFVASPEDQAILQRKLGLLLHLQRRICRGASLRQLKLLRGSSSTSSATTILLLMILPLLSIGFRLP